MSLLIIEDDRPFVELLRHWLGDRKIRIAETLREAQKMITAEAPKFIVVDLSLPDSNAMNTLANIRKLREESKDAVVIVITGAPRPEFEEKATAAGADVFLNKDDPQGFFAKLTNAIEHPPKRAPSQLCDAVERVEAATLALVSHTPFPSCPVKQKNTPK